MDKYVKNKEEFLSALSKVLDTLGLPSDRVHVLSTAYYQTQALGELYDFNSYSAYIAVREMFPITAEFRESLKKWGKVTDVSAQSAKPSVRWFTLSMNIDDVLAEAEMINDKIYRYVLPYTTEISIEEFTYSLDYDIHIQIFDPNGKRAVTAKYDMNTLYNPISDIVNPNIKIILQGNNLILSLPLKQYKRRVSTYRYIDTSTDVMTIKYTDELVDFTPYYRVTEFSNDVTRLEKSMYYSRGIPDKPTIYYSLNDGEITITNRGYRGNFIPVRDSSIELSMYLTKGSKGNFQYIGTDVKLGDNDNNELPFYVEVATDEDVSIKGISEDSIEELRKKTIDALHTRDSLITEYDLNLHYGDSFKVVKTRDDWVTRVYSIYATLVDKDNYLVPTNTMNIELDYTKLEHNGDYYKVPENAKFFATKSANVAKMKDVGASEDIFEYSPSTILSINRPRRVVETYEMYLNRSEPTVFEYNFDKSAYSFMVNRLHVEREPTKSIKFRFNIMTNLTDIKVPFHTVTPEGLFVDNGQLKCHISFESTEGVYAGFVECKMVKYIEENDMYEFEAEVETDYFIRNKTVDLKLKNKDTSVLETKNCPILLNSIKIVVQDNGSNIDNSSAHYGVPSIEGKALVNVFSVDKITLIKHYTDLSGIQLKDVSKNVIQALAVPLFGNDYIQSKGYSILNKVYSDLDFINTKWLLTQTNFVNNYKFINTYGKSNNYNIGNGVDPLDSVRISMSFKVGLVYNASIDLEYVRDYIVQYFKEVKFLNDEDFHVSDLIRAVRDNIPDVSKIEFVSINNYNTDYQYIVPNYDIDDPTVIPELINLGYNDKGIYNVIIHKI